MSQETVKSTQRGRRNEEVGVVISDKMDKTRKVEIQRQIRHKKYGKFLKTTSVFKAHDEKNESRVGDRVRIFETRRLSKTKNWKIAEIVEKAKK